MAKKHSKNNRSTGHVRSQSYRARSPLYFIKSINPVRSFLLPTQLPIYVPRRLQRSPVQTRIVRTPVRNRSVPTRILSTALSDVRRLQKAYICARRKIRREVIFAKGRAGGSHRPQKFTQKSTVRC